MSTLPFVSTGVRVVAEAAAEAIRPKTRERLAEWGRKRHRLSVGASSDPGPWNPDFTPYVYVPLDMFQDRRVREVTLCWGSQLGKTECLNIVTEESLDRGRSVIWAWPSESRAAEEGRRRVLPSMRLAGLPVPSDMGATGGVLGNGAELKMGGTRTGGLDRGRTTPVVLNSETEDPKFDPSAIENLRQRLSNFPDGTMGNDSTPLHEGGYIWTRWQASQQHRFYVPCPFCGHYQVLRFSSLAWEGGADAGTERAYETGHLRCEACWNTGTKIEQHHKKWMLAFGLWVADEERIESTGEILTTRDDSVSSWAERSLAKLTRDEMRDPPKGVNTLGVTIADPAEVGRHVGFQMGKFYSPWVSPRELAEEFVDQGGSPSAEWWGGQAAEPRRGKGLRVSKEELADLVGVGITEPGHTEGVVAARVADAGHIVIGADVQIDRVVVEVIGFHPPAEPGAEPTCDLIEYLEIPREVGDQLAGFTSWLDSVSYPVVGRLDQRVCPHVVALDSGQWAGEVYDVAMFQAERRKTDAKLPRILPVKGDNKNLSSLQPVKWSKVGSLESQRLQGHVDIVWINDGYWKTYIYSMLSASLRLAQGSDAEAIGVDGQTVTANEKSGRWRFPRPRDESGAGHYPGSYLRQLASEELVEDVDEKTGRVTRKWCVRAGYRDNHALDCRKYACALAALLKVPGVGVYSPSRPSASQKTTGTRNRSRAASRASERRRRLAKRRGNR